MEYGGNDIILNYIGYSTIYLLELEGSPKLKGTDCVEADFNKFYELLTGKLSQSRDWNRRRFSEKLFDPPWAVES
ncbi:hypothetical protein CEXT_30391 [Caerostris extrusa]|uniref:Uncharacterized protein n=1 Tax=Caerostris extrusa TaxID=172846 RepID=A0AAV4QRP4_CAEEX|nr:hypothetical protein CEXT_30391 [Caerostris extrusa]